MAERRLYTEIVEQIVAWIEEGKFPPGTRLPGERELAAEFGVSRVTVREAQIALQARGLITVKSGSGAKVCDAPGHVGLPKVDAFELTQARTLFESEAAALAATQVGDNELAQLDAIVERMGAKTGDDESLNQDADKDFHLTIARASKNPVIVDTIERLWFLRSEVEEIREAYASICGITPEMRLQEHADIVTALRNRDPQGARQAMRHHFACILQALLDDAEQRAINDARRKIAESRDQYLKSAGAIA